MIFVPEPFRDFLPYVSPKALQVIHFSEVFAHASKISESALNPSKKSVQRKKFISIFEAESNLEFFEIVSEKPKKVEIETLTIEEKTYFGESLLNLYFFLVLKSPLLSLDLRLDRFGFHPRTRKIQFHPSSLFFEPSEYFQGSVGTLYKGFYDQDQESWEQGLGLYRWKCAPTIGYDSRIEHVLKHHFGIQDASSFQFSMEHFKNSFALIFEEAKQSKAKLHSELPFLGMALATLYSTLDPLKVPLNVRKSYRKFSS